ncbi:MAG TPA: SET domain-containing protein-lysine N-methyltransferase [Rhabdochlamydiaceae bacterium]|nr:SET domain-containing protein-lysine N-methyltransferase [Rhabdochlamydiaceae bacterium]
MKTYNVLFKDQTKPSYLNLNELQEKLQFTYVEQLATLHADEKEKMTLEGPNYLNSEAEENGKKYQSLIESSFTPKVSVRWVSEEVGYGLFAEEDLREGSYVGEYVGQIRKNDEHGTFNHYLYSYPVLDFIGRNYVIDATCGNLLRFANHSFEFNLKKAYAYFPPFYHAIFITCRPIVKGEQLTYNYGKKYWYLRGTPRIL